MRAGLGDAPCRTNASLWTARQRTAPRESSMVRVLSDSPGEAAPAQGATDLEIPPLIASLISVRRRRFDRLVSVNLTATAMDLNGTIMTLDISRCRYRARRSTRSGCQTNSIGVLVE